MKILVVDDEIKTTAFLRKGLSEQGYSVDTAFDGEQGLQFALDRLYDLIVLDVMMPKVDGWKMMERLRKSGRRTPTLMLTARDSVGDRVRGIDLGADAYLVKPFSFSELLASVQSLLRQSSGKANDVIQVANLAIDLNQRRVTRAGQRIELTGKEFLVLVLLARRKGEVIPRTRIEEHVWNMTSDIGSNVLDVHMARLRSKVDGPFERKLIRTIRGVGYILDERDA